MRLTSEQRNLDTTTGTAEFKQADDRVLACLDDERVLENIYFERLL
jgi:hypothetical protein